jgi:hypothetical protein
MDLGIRDSSEGPERPTRHELHNSLRRAVDMGITVLMPVPEPRIGDQVGQSDFHPEGVLNIAASRWNESFELPPPRSADFTLVDDVSSALGGDGSHKEGTRHQEIKGSSVSTAVAAGLAASILLCVGNFGKSRDFRAKDMERVFKSLLGEGDSKMILSGKLASLIRDFRDPHDLARHFVDVAGAPARY